MLNIFGDTTRHFSPQSIKISGINRDGHRVDLVLHAGNGEQSLVIGKVRPSYVAPAHSSKVSFSVNHDEMDRGALQRLYELRDMNRLVTISAGDIQFKGIIKRLTEGLGGGAFDGINIPHNPVLMIDLAPAPKAQTPGRCSKCGRAMAFNQSINTPQGTLCRHCFG